jgi:hypothetical protein
VAVGHMVTPPPRPSERVAIPAAMDHVIATGLAKQPADRYSTTIEMASAAKEAVTDTGAAIAAPPAPPPQPPAGGSSAQQWPQQPWTQVGNTPAPYPASAPTQFSGPHHVQQPPPPRPSPPKKSSGRHGILIGAAVFVVTLLVVGGVIGFIELTQGDESASSAPSAAAPGGVDFSGTYRADYGPGTDLDDKPVANAPATTSNWAVRSECGAAGCVATAANVSGGGTALLSNMTFDQMNGAWVAVGLASAECGGEGPSEVWVITTLQPLPDGTLTGDSVRASADSLCAAKRTVKFTRTGDPDPNKVPDPSVLPPRVTSPAEGLRGSYLETTTFADGSVVPGKNLTADTYCLRTGDRCMSLFHAGGQAVTLLYADEKWARNEKGTTACGAGGTAQMTITADYPMPNQLDDPISVLTGRGTQTVAPGGACTGGGDFDDRFERTGD